MAQFLKTHDLVKRIETKVRFARARFDHFDLIDFVAVLIGYTLSGEPSIQTFYARLAPFSDVFMALFERSRYRAELRQALQAITAYATALALPLSHVIMRVDGLYGNTAPVNEILSCQCGVIGRSKQYAWLDLSEVQARLQSAPDGQVTHPESGTVRDLYDCLTAQGPLVRLLVATHPAGAHKPTVGVVRKETVYELFYTTLPPHAFTPSDVLQISLHRGSFETVLSDEDQEQDPDRWVSRTACGQEFWQIIAQWMWNLRLELGQHLTPCTIRVMEFSPAQVTEPAAVAEPATVAEAQATAGKRKGDLLNRQRKTGFSLLYR